MKYMEIMLVKDLMTLGKNKNASWTLTMSVSHPEICEGVMALLWVMPRPQGLTG
jgi:hypothetical protein